MNNYSLVFLFPAWSLALIVGIAAFLRIRKKRWEQVIPRLIIMTVYIYSTYDPQLDFNVRAFYARWSLTLLLMVEILAELIMWYRRQK